MNKKNNNVSALKVIGIVFLCYFGFSLFINLFATIGSRILNNIDEHYDNKNFRIIASTSVEKMEDTIRKYAKKVSSNNSFPIGID